MQLTDYERDALNRFRLIQKIYQVDPLICPKCQGVMRIISFIEDAQVIRDILTQNKKNNKKYKRNNYFRWCDKHPITEEEWEEMTSPEPDLSFYLKIIDKHRSISLEEI